jgi:hypothetical protein
MNLEHDAKNRVLMEETYRAEVRKQLEAISGHRGNKVIKFFNTSLGLWLLSAIFISGAGAIYQGWQKELDAEKVRTQQKITEDATNTREIERLDIELSFRLSQALVHLSTIPDRVAALAGAGTESELELAIGSATFAVMSRLASAVKSERETLYSENAEYSVPALMAELRRRLPREERPSVERSLAALATLASQARFSRTRPAPEQAAAILHKKIILSRWRGTAFQYIDCNATKPFC